MCLAWVVDHVLLAWVVLYVEVLLHMLVQQPEVTHFHCARLLALDGVVHDTYGCTVVDVYWCWGLWMSHFGECEADDARFLGIEEEGS